MLIIGGSTRAAAWSAVRAGFHPICLDAFADEDLKSVATVLPLDHYPKGVIEAAAALPGSIPWMYTGGMENSPRRIDAISRQRRLWGNAGSVVRTIRDPMQIEIHADRYRGLLRSPQIWSGTGVPPRDGTWMLKPRRGSGGRGVLVWDESARNSPTLKESHWFQERMDGMPLSSLCLALTQTTEVLGFCRQWNGTTECGATGFQYCGSIGPIELPAKLNQAVSNFAEQCRARHGLRGLFGVDFLFDGSTLWVMEINPRYTASVELYEFSRGRSLLARHAAACRMEFGAGPPAQEFEPVAQCIGKAVIYARKTGPAPELPVSTMNGWLPRFADIPKPGSLMLAGTPLCTVFSTGEDADGCEASLLEEVLQQRWGALS